MRLPNDSSTDEVLCEEAILACQKLYFQYASLSSKLQSTVFDRLTINWGHLALEKNKAELLGQWQKLP